MINSKTIEDAIYNLCIQANTVLPDDVFEKISNAYISEKNEDAKQVLGLILQNAQMAYEKKMPLCQDTGQVLFFVKGGKCIPQDINKIINNAVSKAYKDNFFRKSVVKNALFDRTNTKTNSPVIIYTEITDCDDIEIEILIKGAGSENVSAIQMLSPTSSEDEIIESITSIVKKAGAKACPPYFIGIGIGGTIEYAGLMSKKALLLNKNIDENHKIFAEKIKNSINNLNIGASGLGGASTVLDVKVLTDFTHIACMPTAVTINCHSTRHAKCLIKENEVFYYSQNKVKNYKSEKQDFSDYIKVRTDDKEKLKTLKQGQKVLLSGEIYTARDMAHKRLMQMLEKGEQLPLDLKDKFIFYAGPCPCSTDCVIGSIGPTTAARMDKFVKIFYQNGLLATIGKGERSEDAKKAIKQNGGFYFTAFGGIACLLADKFIKKDLVAFEDLGAEAIYRFEIEDLPLILEVG